MVEISHKVENKGAELEGMMRANGEIPAGSDVELPVGTRKILNELKNFGELQYNDLKNLWERRKEQVYEKEKLMETNDNLTSTIKFGQKEIEGLKENNKSLLTKIKNEKQKISSGKTAKIETSKVNDRKLGELEKFKLQISGAQKRLEKLNQEMTEEEMTSDVQIEALRKTQNDFMSSNQSLRKLICQNSNLTSYFKDRLDDAVGRLDREQENNNRLVEDLIHTERERINDYDDGSSMPASLKKSSPRRGQNEFSMGRSTVKSESPARTLNGFNTANSRVKKEENIFDLMREADSFAKSIPATVESLKREKENSQKAPGMKISSYENQMKAKIMDKLDLL